MINISVVELIPSLFLDEDEEEQQTYGNHQQVQRLAPDTESEGTLEIDAERNQHSVCSELSMHPAEPIGKANDDPGNEPEQRAVEYPFREFYLNAEREHSAVNQHYKRTNWMDNTYYQPAGFPKPDFQEGGKKILLLPLDEILFFHFYLEFDLILIEERELKFTQPFLTRFSLRPNYKTCADNRTNEHK